MLSRTALNGDIPGGILALLAFGLGMSAPVVIATASEPFNAVAARFARQRRTAFIWMGGAILIAAGLIELLPQTMAPIMTATDQIARRAMRTPAVWIGGGVIVSAALLILLWLWNQARRQPTPPKEEKSQQ